MANAVAVAFNPAAERPSYAVAKQEASSLTKSLAGSGYPGKRISIKGCAFRLIDQGKEIAAIEERYLDIVIVRAAEHIGRTYYAEDFDEAKATAPDCWSADGVAPDTTASKPQCENCASCPQNIKGSGKDESRACRFSQRIAVVLANDMEGDVLQLNLPATSLFGKEEGDNRPLQAYARYLSANKANVEQFITRMKFDLGAPNPKLFFKPMRWLTPEEYEVCKAQSVMDEATRAVTMTVAQTDNTAAKLPATLGKPLPPVAAKPAPAEPVEAEEPPAPAPAVGKGKKKPAAKPAAVAQPAPAADDEPPAPEPKVRPQAATPTMPTRTAVAQVAAEWDTDD
jgi:hypothetical protein